MRGAALRFLPRLTLAIFLTGTTHYGAPIGFADLPRLLAAHPLQAVLAGYDRGIAALRSTQTVPGLLDPAAQAQRGAAALQRDAAAAQSRVQQIASRNAGQNRLREREALAAVLAARNAADREMMAYREELVRGTNANLAAYERSLEQRTQRALAAREQQLRESELMLAFTLARQNAGERALLRLKLEELHLDPATQTQLEAELSAMNARESDALAVMRRNDAGILERYRQQLQRDGEAANAQMAAQLRAKAEANLVLRRRVLQAEASMAAMLPNLPLQIASFSASYRSETDAAAILGGLRSASRDLSQLFGQFAEAAQRSQRETAAQIQALEAKRSSVYYSMIAQIEREAQRLARERRLGGVDVSGSRPKDSVDLTAAVRADLARF